jgi:glc operon protein GlcG
MREYSVLSTKYTVDFFDFDSWREVMRQGVVHRSLAAAILSLTAATIWAEELPTKKALSLGVAKQVAAAAEKHASANKWNVCIAVVDDGGHLVYFQRMDGTQTGSVQVSQRKAQTAIAFKRPSKVFEEGVAGGRNALLGLPGAVPLEGGVPLAVDGQMIGAIGISGVTAQQDGMIAQAGADALAGIVGK